MSQSGLGSRSRFAATKKAPRGRLSVASGTISAGGGGSAHVARSAGVSAGHLVIPRCGRMPQRSTVKLGPGRGEVNGQRLRGCPAGTALGLSPATTSPNVRPPFVQRWIGPLHQQPVADVRAPPAPPLPPPASPQLLVLVTPRLPHPQR